VKRWHLLTVTVLFASSFLLYSQALAEHNGPSVNGGIWTKKKSKISKGSGGSGSGSETPIETNPIKITLNAMSTAHPHIILTPERINQIKIWNQQDPMLKERRARTVQSAINILNVKPAVSTWIKNKNGNLDAILKNLDLARLAGSRIELLALVYYMTGESRYAVAAKRELNALTSITSFDADKLNMLTVAEANLAVSLGYDWLYPTLSDKEKKAAQTFITNRIQMSLKAYAANQFWVGTPYNWGMVINSSMIVGGLAISDTNKDLAFQVLTPSLTYAVPAYKVYSDDGGHVEGTMYWEYATRFMAIAADALDTAANNTFAFAQLSEPSKSGDFKLYAGGPGTRAFDFGDSYEPNYPASVMFWLAKRYNQPAYSYLTRKMMTDMSVPLDAFAYLWYEPRGTAADLYNLPTSKAFDSINVAMLRTSWTDTNALSAGLKAATPNTSSHCQLDGGTFVLDALGERWGVEVGYSNSTYRFGTAGQNTLQFGGVNQSQTVKSTRVSFDDDSLRPYAIYDLGDSNPGKASEWQRGLLLNGNRYALLQDEFTATRNSAVVWGMHTRSSVSLNGATATLTQNGKACQAVILQPTGATFRANAVAGETGLTKMTINLVGTGSAQSIVVAFIPVTAGAQDPRSIVVLPLSSWSRLNQGP
jgi:hypothetical protein